MELSSKHKYSFPVILGMNPGEPLSTRAPRMKTYAEMVLELDSGGARYSQDLSEVDLSDLEDVKVRVNDPAGDVLVHLGSSDYLRRYKIYVSHAQGWRQQFQKLESVDLRYDNQIIVNPDMPHTAKAVAAAAAVKPAALVTRLAPHDRAVPKPAFELTEKKFDSKAAASGAKKTAARPRGKRAAAKTGKAIAGAKKTAVGKLMASRPTTTKSAAAIKTSLTASHDSATGRVPADGKQPPAPSPKATMKPSGVSAGQKPSPAVIQGPGQ